jgi:transcriptional regulator of arginine metabolism
VLSIEFSKNIGVIKTRQGHADSVALALDILSIPEILGTVAGDDTIFVILREGMTKEDLTESFKTRIPEIDT